MFNPYEHHQAKIIFISRQTDNIKLFRFEFTRPIPGWKFSYKPGQFVELSLPNFGESPFAPCGDARKNYLELCVRKTGKLTAQLHQMRIGDKVGLRGAYGNGVWPLAKYDFKTQKNLLIVAGGLGFVPLRSLILDKNNWLGQETKVQIFYGARQPNEMLFRHEYEQWKKQNIQVELTVDRECSGWKGNVGLVPTLFDKHEVWQNSIAFICGPPVMYRPILDKLKKLGFVDEDIYLSLERRMHCGFGVCQHCAVGSYYTCKDGPIFSWAQLKDIPGAI
ncbi:FAD/NAD(P)-binding protein [Patescibacteria group bacterium]|nr:FAD/NAD(P)-binding protein [Patescibacteria group bacterium]MBU2219621.1 FAD/NAD(P)-binding protein [Patescibacteria group bacterium]MBU2265307.1 FAD/NAD(P)-binding protein [Patescibacteria group bacterium]